MKVIAYTRVSTEKQTTLDLQLDSIQQYCKLYDHEIVEVISEKESGRNENRKGLKTVLDLIKKENKADAIIVYNLSRLARKLSTITQILQEVKVVSVKENINSDSANGLLIINLLSTVAQFEVDQLKERVKTKLQWKIANNERCGSVKYGYELASDGLHLEENQIEQKIIQRASYFRGKGLSYKKISDRLAVKGYLARNGKPLAPQQVKNICLLAA